MDANPFLKRIVLVGIVSTLPAFALAAPPGGGGHGGGGRGGGGWHGGAGWHGGGGHFSGGRGAVPVGYSHGYGHGGSWRGGSWHGGSWHGSRGSWRGHGNWHHHHRFSFGFYPYWYPGWGYYGYGYPYYDYGYPYYAGDYDDYYYPDDAYYRPSASTGDSAEILVQDSLARRGYYGGQVDGVIGPETRGAIREFQHDYGLTVNGRITPQLVQAMRKGND
jgi:Putative peptidoglycan binding domain